MLSTVEVQGNQLKLGSHPKDTAGSQRLQFMAKSPLPSSSLGAWSILQCYSVSLFSLLCTPASMFTGSFVLAAPKAWLSPAEWLILWSPITASLEKEIAWGVSSGIPFSYQERRGWGRGHCYRSCLLTSVGPLVSRSAQSTDQRPCSSATVASPSFTCFTSSPHPYQRNREPRELWIFFTLIPVRKASSAIEINPRFLKVWRKCWGRNHQHESWVWW